MPDPDPDTTVKIEEASQEAGEDQVVAGLAGEELPAEAGDSTAEEELGHLRQELEDAQARQAEYLDGWQRARAELANARKRFQREQEQAYGNARGDVLVRLLPILDDFELALESIPEEVLDAPWIEGIRLIAHKFQRLLEQEGVTSIEAAGQEFDPLLHQAVTHEPSEAMPAGHVISVLRSGYRLGDQVLRPSMVRVSSGPEVEGGVGVESTPGEASSD